MLDLIDRVPEELWTEALNIIQEAVIKTTPRKRNAKIQNGCLRRPYKELRKEEKLKAKEKKKNKRYTHLNAEFQRIAQRHRKPSSVINAKNRGKQ